MKSVIIKIGQIVAFTGHYFKSALAPVDARILSATMRREEVFEGMMLTFLVIAVFDVWHARSIPNTDES